MELNHPVTLVVNNVDAWQKQGSVDTNKLTLFLDGVAMPELKPTFINNNTQIIYTLDYLPASSSDAALLQNTWRQLLKSGRDSVFSFSRKVIISLGYDGKQFPSAITARLIVVDPVWFKGFGVFTVLLLGFFFWLTIKSDVLREPGAQPHTPAGSSKVIRKPFSLSRFQMAAWFFVVLVSYLFIWIVTSDLSNLTPSVLGLIGISAATGLGSAAVDSGKLADQQRHLDGIAATLKQNEVERENLQTQIDLIKRNLEVTSPHANQTELQNALATKSGELAGKEQEIVHGREQIHVLNKAMKPAASNGFINDILSDDGGVSFHRFQIFSWSIALIVIFISKVCNDLSMPDFDGNLLALMGISSGTYLGFKLPTNQG